MQYYITNSQPKAINKLNALGYNTSSIVSSKTVVEHVSVRLSRFAMI